jgi:protein-S-isoprenylcysteine O-methyltransferase Ste14
VPSYAEWAARLRVPLHFLLALLFFAFAQPEPVLLPASAVVVVLGLGLRAWAAGHLRRDSPVTVSGPYAHLRHPLYWGSAIILVGFAVTGGLLWLAGLLAVYYLLVFIPVMRHEERTRLTLASEQYAAYRTQVPAFLPRLRPAQMGEQSRARFTFHLYLANQEWRAAVGCALLLLLLWGKMRWG